MRLTFNHPSHATSTFLNAYAEPALHIRFEEAASPEAVEAFVIVGTLFGRREVEEAPELNAGFTDLLIAERTVRDVFPESIRLVFAEVLGPEEVVESPGDEGEGVKRRSGEVRCDAEKDFWRNGGEK